jgi:hypothetical protein
LAVRIEKREDQRLEAEVAEQQILIDPGRYFRDERARVSGEVQAELTQQQDEALAAQSG